MKTLPKIIFVFTLSILLAHFAWGAETNNKKTLDPEMEKLIASAEQGDAKSQACLAEFYLMGMNVDRNPAKANDWLQKAASQDNLRAKLVLAELETRDPEKHSSAINNIQELADQHYAAAEEQVGLMYLQGGSDSKYPQNFTAALNWFHKAAKRNFPFAEADLGLAYRYGWGVKPDLNRARAWAKQAANNQIDCAPDVVPLIQRLITINAIYPQSVLDGSRQGRVLVKMFNHNGKFTHPILEKASGHKDIDMAALKTMAVTPLPSWTGMGASVILPVNLTQAGIDPVLYSNYETKLYATIQKAMVIPRHVLIYGSKGPDKATASFKCLNGHAMDIKIVKSSNDTYEDAAAIAAIKKAQCPPTPQTFTGITMPFSFTLNFALP
ncbi:MAG TPA: tetratricopeptide repeat protein [Gammaproteobacteria bacterium]|nr:tetratricopeptide repeat protein [Gammaproteobacteria bacterium]